MYIATHLLKHMHSPGPRGSENSYLSTISTRLGMCSFSKKVSKTRTQRGTCKKPIHQPPVQRGSRGGPPNILAIELSCFWSFPGKEKKKNLIRSAIRMSERRENRLLEIVIRQSSHWLSNTLLERSWLIWAKDSIAQLDTKDRSNWFFPSATSFFGDEQCRNSAAVLEDAGRVSGSAIGVNKWTDPALQLLSSKLSHCFSWLPHHHHHPGPLSLVAGTGNNNHNNINLNNSRLMDAGNSTFVS